jgi:hypothetical protein
MRRRDRARERAARGLRGLRQHAPRGGGRRLDRTLSASRGGDRGDGHVVDNDPLTAVKDAIAIEEPDELIVSTHPEAKSGWRRRNLLDEIRKAAGDRRSSTSSRTSPRARRRERPRRRERDGARGAAARPHPREGAHERRSELPDRLAAERSGPGRAPGGRAAAAAGAAQLRSEGIEAHGQVAHPDPFTAAMHAVRDESIDAILVSTFPEQRGSSWLRRDLIGRLTSEAEVPSSMSSSSRPRWNA